MSRRMKIRGVVATEELEEIQAAAVAEEGDDVVDPVDEVEDHAESAETELIDAEDTEEAADDEAEDAEEGQEVAEALEGLVDILREASAGAGLDPIAAKLLHASLESLYSRVSFDTMQVVSLEDFNGATSRIRATNVSMEDIKENAKKTWESTVAAIKRFWEMLKEWWTKLFSAVSRYEARAKQLAGVASKLKGAPKEKEIKSGLGKELHIGNSVDPLKAVQVLGSVLGQVKVVQEGIASIAKKATNPETVVEAYHEAEKFTTGKLTKAVSGEGFKGESNARSVELPGGKAIVATKNGDSLKVGVSDYSPSAAGHTSETLPTLAPQQIAKLANEVAKVAAGIISLNDDRKKAEAEVPGLMESLKKIFEKSEASDEERAQRKAVLSFARDLLAEPSKSYAAYATRTLGSLLNYAELSIKQYAAAEAAAAAPEATPAAAE